MSSSVFELFLFVLEKALTATNEHANGIMPSRFVWNCLRVSQRVGPGFRQPISGASVVENSLRIYNIEATRGPTVQGLGESTVLAAAANRRGAFIGSATDWIAGWAALDGCRDGRQKAQAAQIQSTLVPSRNSCGSPFRASSWRPTCISDNEAAREKLLTLENALCYRARP
jgi:hypothetical protein